MSIPSIPPRSHSESAGSSKKLTNLSSTPNSDSAADIDPNFRSIVIYVYRNGDEFDKGVEVTITRKHFKHWLNLLEYLTKRCNCTKPVSFVYTMAGEGVKGFRQLEDGGEFVAASGPFKQCRYRSKAKKDFKVEHRIQRKDPPSLDSSESYEMFLRRTGYHKGKEAKYPEDIFDDSSLDLKGTKNPSRVASLPNTMKPPPVGTATVAQPPATKTSSIRPPSNLNGPRVAEAKFGRNAGVMDKYLSNQPPQNRHRNLVQLRSYSDEGSQRPPHVDSRRSSEYEDRLYRTAPLPPDSRSLGRSPLAGGYYTPPPARGYYSRESDRHRYAESLERQRIDYDDRFYQRPPPNYPQTPVELDEITRRLNFLESQMSRGSVQPYDDRRFYQPYDRDPRGYDTRRDPPDPHRSQQRSNTDVHSAKVQPHLAPEKLENHQQNGHLHTNEPVKPTPKPTAAQPQTQVKLKPSSPKYRLPTRENTIDDSSSFANLKILLNDNKEENSAKH